MIGMPEYARRLAMSGARNNLRRIRYARSRLVKQLAMVGNKYRLIDESWLKGMFNRGLDALLAEEVEVLEKIRCLKELRKRRNAGKWD